MNLKLRSVVGVSSALCLAATAVQAQETNQPVDIDQRLKQMQEMFDQRERDMESRFEKKIAEQDAEIKSLQDKLAMMPTNQTSTPAAELPVAGTSTPPTNAAAITDMISELNDKVDSVVEAQKKTLPGEFNPAIGFVGETLFSYRDRAANEIGSDRPGGFDVFQRSVELNAAAAVDPFVKGYVVANASADAATGEDNVQIEEAAAQTMDLPGNLSLTGGRFFGEFGRLANIHDHELPFVNRPLVLDEYIGGEAQTDGAQLNWLVPVDHYISVTAGVGDKFGADYPNPEDPGPKREFGGLSFWGRASTDFDLSDNWQLETGLSGLWTPKEEDRGGVLVQPDGSTRTEKDRRLVGLDMRLSWVPLQNNQFNSFTWGTEMLFSDNRYLFDPDGALNPTNASPHIDANAYYGYEKAWGMYSYATYKWSRQWSGGFLYDYVEDMENKSAVSMAFSPYVTFALSHWNQLRLQYTHTDRSAATGLRPDDAIYLQWTWIIGAHSHGWSQR